MFKVNVKKISQFISEQEGIIFDKTHYEAPHCSPEFKVSKTLRIKEEFYENPSLPQIPIFERYECMDKEVLSFLKEQKGLTIIDGIISFSNEIGDILKWKVGYLLFMWGVKGIGTPKTIDPLFDIDSKGEDILNLYSKELRNQLREKVPLFLERMGVVQRDYVYKVPLIHFRINHFQEIQGAFHRYLSKGFGEISSDLILPKESYFPRTLQDIFRRYSGEEVFLSQIKLSRENKITPIKDSLSNKIKSISLTSSIKDRFFFGFLEQVDTGIEETLGILYFKNSENILYRILNDYTYYSGEKLSFSEEFKGEDGWPFLDNLKYAVFFENDKLKGYYGKVLNYGSDFWMIYFQ